MVEIAPTALLNHLFSISRLLAGQLDFRSAIRAVATEVANILPHDHMDVCIVRLDGKCHTAYESGIETAWGGMPHAPVAASPIRPLLMGEVGHMLTCDAPADPRFDPGNPSHGPIFDHTLRSRINVPMQVHGDIIGAFSVSLRLPDRYTPQDVTNARYIADLLSPYFYALRAAEQAQEAAIAGAEVRAREEGLRQGALRLTEALEAERQRIGMDLHDQTLADLTRLARQIDWLARATPGAAGALEPVSRGLQDCMQDLRQIIEEAKPSVLHLFGFSQAVENYLERAVRGSGQTIAVTLQDDADAAFDQIDATVSVALYRIVQEAINNATNHARASRIAVHLSRSDGQVEIAVTDNGTGIAKRRLRSGSGINNMRTRARLIAARFTLGAGEGGTGTRVTIALPFTPIAMAAQ